MNNFGKKSILSIVTCITLASSALAVENKVHVVVNGEKITSNDIATALRNPNINFQTLPKEQQEQILNGLIDQKVLSQEAYKSNIKNSKEFKDELEKIKQNLAYQIWMRDLSKTIKADEKELKSFYNENKSKFQKPAELKASHILVKTEDEAKKIIDDLKKSKSLKSDFTKTAKTKSTGPSGKSGGELGWFTKEKMVPEFSNAALKLSIGTITKTPVKTQFGYHIIYLDDKKEAQAAPFEQIKNNIKQELMQKKFMEKLQEKSKVLKTKAKIEYK
ncbi:MAG: peptidylprolyl isomerase [Campylobacterota bacterium]|nr:peptidylprolyl isomerase [Campylobacterota bacterium]